MSEPGTEPTAPRWLYTTRTTNLALLALGVLLLAAALAQNAVIAHDRLKPGLWFLFAQVLIYFPAAWIVSRGQPARSTVVLALVGAAAFRLIAWHPDPYLSNDLYRYIWDGRVQAAGINPYRHVPHDPELVSLRDEKIYGSMNRKEYAPTIYPPGAELAFLAITRISESVGMMRLAMVFFEGITIYLLVRVLRARGEPDQRLLIYAWHPLTIWEFAGNGHVDALMLACLAAAILARLRGRDGWTGAALGAAVLVKLYPVILFPAFYRRWNWRMPVALASVVAGGYAIYSSVGSRVLGFLPDYAREEGLENGSRYFLLGVFQRFTGIYPPAVAFKYFAILVLGAIGLAVLWRRRGRDPDGVASAAILAIAFMMLLSPAYPWYYSWLVLFLPLLRWTLLYWLTGASFCLYIAWSRYALDEYEMNRLLLPVGLALAGAALAIYFRRQPHLEPAP